MRRVSLLVLISGILVAQAPIGLGPGTMGMGMIDYFNWHKGTSSGCSTAQGANGGQ
jgi:hypothetical protein